MLVESTVTNLKDGNPGKQYIKQAIEKQMDIVAISKGALVTNWREINEAAKLRMYEFDIVVQLRPHYRHLILVNLV